MTTGRGMTHLGGALIFANAMLALACFGLGYSMGSSVEVSGIVEHPAVARMTHHGHELAWDRERLTWCYVPGQGDLLHELKVREAQ